MSDPLFNPTYAPPSFYHAPVLLSEVVAGLAPRAGGRYIDGTLGGGGHTLAFLAASVPSGQVLGIDADPEALVAAAARLGPFAERATLVHGNFRDMAQIAHAHGFAPVDGILLDLGVSSHQLDTPERGFSFMADAPLDMRLDPTGGPSAADLVNQADETELANIIYHYGEERGSRRIARLIVEARQRRPISTTAELAELVSRALGGRRGKIHPATRTFQALRIAVNRELESLETVLPQALDLLVPGGRLAVIAFHSLEDRIVKQFFRAEAGKQPDNGLPFPLPNQPEPVARLRIITNKPVMARDDEQESNPRSRSAKLRIAEKLDDW